MFPLVNNYQITTVYSYYPSNITWLTTTAWRIFLLYSSTDSYYITNLYFTEY